MNCISRKDLLFFLESQKKRHRTISDNFLLILKRIKEKNAWSDIELSRRTNSSLKTVQGWLTKTESFAITADTVFNLSKELDIPIDFFLIRTKYQEKKGRDRNVIDDLLPDIPF